MVVNNFKASSYPPPFSPSVRLEAELEKLQKESVSGDSMLFSTPCWNMNSPWDQSGILIYVLLSCSSSLSFVVAPCVSSQPFICDWLFSSQPFLLFRKSPTQKKRKKTPNNPLFSFHHVLLGPTYFQPLHGLICDQFYGAFRYEQRQNRGRQQSPSEFPQPPST